MKLIRALMLLYPASFRNDYEEQLSEIFVINHRAASGWTSQASLYIEAIMDTVSNAIRVHWDILFQDVHYTLRTLRRTPGFTLTALAVAAIGIGATTAAFTVTDHVLLRPLPFLDSDRLVKLWEDQSPQGYEAMEPSPALYRDWKRFGTGFAGMVAYFTTAVNLVGAGEPERLEGAVVTADLLPLLGVRPAVGRIFASSDDTSGAPPTVILSESLWKRRFAGESGALGQTVNLDGNPYTIIGVLPANLTFPSPLTQFWIPARFGPADYQDRSDNYLNVIAKLRPGQSIEQARAEMRTVSAQLEHAYPKENLHVKSSVKAMRDDLSQKTRQLLIAVMAAALCVLLIACANLANLLLARALARRKELAVRTALGVGRERLVRQLLTESLILALAGGALGVLLAFAVLPLLSQLVPNGLPISKVPEIDLRVLTFAALVAIATGLAFGVLPSLRACGNLHFSGLREGSRGGVGGRKEHLRSALVMAEVAGSVVLLVSVGLLIRALWRVEAVNPGFRAAGVLTLKTSLPQPKYNSSTRRAQFYNNVLDQVRTLPGVTGAAYSSFLPLAFGGGIWHVTVEGAPPDPVKARDTGLRVVTPGFFDTMGIALRQGRDLSELDHAETAPVAVVTESFIKKYWPGQNGLEHYFEIAGVKRRVVGIVADVKVRGLERTSEPQVYVSYRQMPDAALTFYAPKNLIVRSSAGASLVPAVRRIIAKTDPEQPVTEVRTMNEIVEADSASRAIQVRVLGAFAAIAILLAGIGLHGLLSFTVSTRAQEFGVRIALGAQRSNILGMVFRQGSVLAGVGLAVGVVLAYASGRTMSALLVGLDPADLPTFVFVVSLCLAMTLAGCLLPAIKAVRLDPTQVMRGE